MVEMETILIDPVGQEAKLYNFAWPKNARDFSPISFFLVRESFHRFCHSLYMYKLMYSESHNPHVESVNYKTRIV